MIIVCLQGGLGNQLFQYAAARALSLQNNTELFFDLQLLNEESQHITKRNFALGVFKMPIKLANAAMITDLQNTGKLKRWLQQKNILQRTTYNEPHYNFDASFLKITGNTIVKGYMQSEKYFKDHSISIKKELEIIAPLSDKTLSIFKAITTTNSVSVHIRRGDYVNDETTKNVHGSCNLSYYENAVNTITLKNNIINLFIFSDDIDWAKKNFISNYPLTFVGHNDDEHAYEDIYLMSNCKHNIIANSSFSWWGAWLNNNIDKIVVAPKKWFNDTTINTNDLIPGEWIKL